MIGQHSIFAFCFQARELVFPCRTVINDENNVLTCSKRAFSDVLEGVVVKNFLGAHTENPVSLPFYFDSSYRPFCVAQ